jgi:hypothetical protein
MKNPQPRRDTLTRVSITHHRVRPVVDLSPKHAPTLTSVERLVLVADRAGTVAQLSLQPASRTERREVLDGQLFLIIRLVVLVLVLLITFVEEGGVVGLTESHLVALFVPVQLLYAIVEKETRNLLVALLLEAEGNRHRGFLPRRLVFGEDDFQTDGRTVASINGLVTQHLHHVVFAQLTQGLGANPLLNFPLLDQSPEKKRKESGLSEITRE